MFGTTYYHETIKKYVSLFGTLYNDIWINRTDNNGNVRQSFKVPIRYGPKEKFLARIDADPRLDKEFAITLPQMGFEIIGYQYAAERKLNTINKFVKSNNTDPDVRNFQYNPVPYDIAFQLSIFVKNTEDGLRIIEQILPYFTPEWTPTVELISDPEIILDIPIYLTSVIQEDVYEGSFEDRRSLIFTLDFTLKGYLFSPTKKSGVIKLANTNFLISDSDAAITSANTESARVTIVPGLTANGAPTSNASNSVDKSLIDAEDDYGYITTIEDPLVEED